MASQISIVNRALIKLGSSRITSIDDDDKTARLAKELWDTTRDLELSAHPWTFAKARAALPALAAVPAFGWGKAFQLPTNFLRMIEVGENYVMYMTDGEVGSLFELEGQTILCDEASPLRIRYVQRITNPGLFPPLFVEALATRLAHEMCESLTQNLTKKQALGEEYQAAIRAARRNNAIELPPQGTPLSSWERAARE
jgi:hypothetical protein